VKVEVFIHTLIFYIVDESVPPVHNTRGMEPEADMT
jgi:hypothetical protein